MYMYRTHTHSLSYIYGIMHTLYHRVYTHNKHTMHIQTTYYIIHIRIPYTNMHAIYTSYTHIIHVYTIDIYYIIHTYTHTTYPQYTHTRIKHIHYKRILHSIQYTLYILIYLYSIPSIADKGKELK